MKKKIIACLCILMFLVASKLAFKYAYNEYVINKFNDGDYDISMKPGMMCNWVQPYVAHYNAGNIYYQNGNYKEAIEEYKLAMDKEPKNNHKCDIRVNMALAMLGTLPEDYASEANLKNTIEVLTQAKGVLIEDGCAKEKEAGHDEEATKLREEIDAMLMESKKAEGSGDDDGGGDEKDDPQNQSGNKEQDKQREQEIKEKLQQQQNGAYKERYEENLSDEEYQDDFDDYDYFDGPIW